MESMEFHCVLDCQFSWWEPAGPGERKPKPKLDQNGQAISSKSVTV